MLVPLISNSLAWATLGFAALAIVAVVALILYAMFGKHMDDPDDDET